MAPDRERRFEPATLVAGLVFLAIAGGFGLAAAGSWHPRPTMALPVMGLGLVLTGLVRAVTRSVRSRSRTSGGAR
ncbi:MULTISPECIES: hypothetical protein [Streptomyces]|uniref:Uncharacterized protein n=1 Tax=Streptomyces silvisoli TaxID=3034235 RepID=A0ABT5ZML7_9ACTN|nr:MULTISPECIES: hypothetical protein [Streptomyces]MDF3291079.1 hypothetical protein [Streptomyces silvisoli]